MKPRNKRVFRRLAYVLLGLFLIAVVGTFGAYKYAMHRIFRDTPNTLALKGEFHPIPFDWAADESEGYTEPHAAILIPVSIPGIPNTLYMQFDTGSPDTFLRSGALEGLKSRGVEFELIKKDERACIKKFELDIAGNRVILHSGHVRGREITIDWDNSEAINIIGSLGADFLDQKVCEIDFPSQEIRLHQDRSEELNALGKFTPFKFNGRRIMLPASIDGSDVEVFYDSGCSAFGLLTSKYHFDRLTDPNEKEIAYGANRHGESVPIHHKSSDVRIQLGSADLSLTRISYAELYSFLQTTIGRCIGGGFLGNKCLTESTLILDTKSNEFLVVEQLNPKMADPASVSRKYEPATALANATRKSSQDAAPNDPQIERSPARITFRLARWNNLSVTAIVNRNFAGNLMFHTAVNEVSLIQSALEKLPEIDLDLETDVESWGGDSRTPYSRGVALSIGPVRMENATVFQSMQSGHQTDGKFAPQQLECQFIEIDFDRSLLQLDQTLPEKILDWKRLELTTDNGVRFVNGSIFDGVIEIKNRFMIHSGYSGFALLDDEFVANIKYLGELEIIAESELTDSNGNKIKTRKATLPQFSIAGLNFENAPVSFFDGAIGRQKFSIIGGDFLKRFNLVFDLENKALYWNKS